MFLVSSGPALSESREVRKKDGDCENGDHVQKPSQKSSTGSNLLVRPQSSPLMPNSTERSGDGPLPCATPNGAATLQYITVQMQQATNCPFNFTAQMFGTDGQQGKQSEVVVETDGQVAEFSCEFGAVVQDIIVAVKEEKKEEHLLDTPGQLVDPP